MKKSTGEQSAPQPAERNLAATLSSPTGSCLADTYPLTTYSMKTSLSPMPQQDSQPALMQLGFLWGWNGNPTWTASGSALLAAEAVTVRAVPTPEAKRVGLSLGSHSSGSSGNFIPQHGTSKSSTLPGRVCNWLFHPALPLHQCLTPWTSAGYFSFQAWQE